MKPITIVAICAICAATLMSGCMESEYESTEDGSYASVLQTPRIQDTDGDGWTDQTERSCGTNPYLKDTDGDGINDPYDSAPLVSYIKPTTPPSCYAPTPAPAKNIPSHADGDPRICGECHAYPSYDNNNHYRKAALNPTPAPTKYYQKPVLSTSPIPSDYYSQPCELPMDQSMQQYLANSDWIDDYDAGGWDCSQMSAYMEYMLSNCGYNVVFRVAKVEGSTSSHAWILVEFEQGWLAYECTGRYWVYPSEDVARSYEPYSYVHWNPSMYDAGVQYENIHEVWNIHKHYSNGEEVFLNEYGWWI